MNLYFISIKEFQYLFVKTFQVSILDSAFINP